MTRSERKAAKAELKKFREEFLKEQITILPNRSYEFLKEELVEKIIKGQR